MPAGLLKIKKKKQVTKPKREIRKEKDVLIHKRIALNMCYHIIMFGVVCGEYYAFCSK